MDLEGLRGLKKGKCLFWVRTGECFRTEKEAETCTAKDGEGYCLSIIVDTKLVEAC